MEKFSNEYKKKLGALLRLEREARGLSQLQLAEFGGVDDENEWICPEADLRDIENGDIVPSIFVLERLSEFFDLDIKEWSIEPIRDVRVRFDNECNEILRMIFAEKDGFAYIMYRKLKKETYYNKHELHYNQCLKLIDAALSEEELGAKKSLKKALNALKLSRPYIQKTNGDLDPGYVEQMLFNLTEYYLINLVAVYTEKIGKIDDAIKIYRSAIKSLESDFVDEDIKRRLIPLFSYNFSNVLIDSNKFFGEALDACSQGIEYSSVNGIGKFVPYLEYNKGKALWCVKENSQAAYYFKSSYDLFELMGDTDSADRVRSITAERYNMKWD